MTTLLAVSIATVAGFLFLAGYALGWVHSRNAARRARVRAAAHVDYWQQVAAMNSQASQQAAMNQARPLANQSDRSA